MIAFAKTDKEWCFWCCILTTNCHQVIVNDLPDLNWEFRQAPFVAFAMPDDGDMMALFHHQIADSQRYRFSTANACTQEEHDECIVPSANRRLLINGIQECLGFLSFQGSMWTFILTSFEGTDAFGRILCQKITLDRLVQQPLNNSPHARSCGCGIGLGEMRPVGNQVVPIQ